MENMRLERLYRKSNDKCDSPFEWFKKYVDTQKAYELLEWNDEQKQKEHLRGLSIKRLEYLLTKMDKKDTYMENYEIMELTKVEEPFFEVEIKGINKDGYNINEVTRYSKEDFERDVIPELMRLEGYVEKLHRNGNYYGFDNYDFNLQIPHIQKLEEVNVRFTDKEGIIRDVDIDYSEIHLKLDKELVR